jgi:hypothetical protein
MIRKAAARCLKYSCPISLLLILLTVPVTASFVFQEVSVSPDPPLSPGQAVSGTSLLVIVPQGGPSTFVGSNQIELTTDLDSARWNVVVMVNGKPAAQIPVNGNTVFINGFLLSYPVSSDVAVSIQINGSVPRTAGPEVTIAEAVQLNNAGQAIPGSAQSVSVPLQVPTPAVTSTIPATPPISPTTAYATKTPGFTAAAGVISLALCGLFLIVSGHVRKT